MKSILHIVGRLLLLLSLVVAPMYGVTAPLVELDMSAAQSQDSGVESGHDMQKHDKGCCDMAGMDGCNGATDCNGGCSTCHHCNVAATLVAIPFNSKLDTQSLVAIADTRSGIVLPIEIRPPQAF